MMTHTPGPWTAENIGAGTDAWGVVAGDQIVVMHDFVSGPDARLIAAAPDMLAACQSVADWFAALKQYQYEQLVLGQTLESASRNWETMKDQPLDLQPLLNAIAKAEG